MSKLLESVRGRLPDWWKRELGHAAGGYAITSGAMDMLGLPAWVPVAGVAGYAVIRELLIDRKKQSRSKTVADIVAWVGSSILAAVVGM